MATDYSIWGLAYARSNMPRDFFGGTLINSNQGQVRNPMVFSAILGGRTGEAARPIVIDTGMKGTWSPSGKGYENVESPATVLAKVGIDAAKVETVVLTHLHFDHAGNLDAFPNATFHVQRAEFEGWKRIFSWEGPLGRDREDAAHVTKWRWRSLASASARSFGVLMWNHAPSCAIACSRPVSAARS